MRWHRGRAARKGRIEIIPMIDVMFFLLVTFMLASLSLQDLRSLPVNLPKGHAGVMQGREPVTITVTKDGRILLDSTRVTLATLAATLKPRLQGKDPAVVMNADAAATHGLVTQAMLQARSAGVARFWIAVKNAN
ncbi:MAG: biopolymer transporter ExbD [Cyanobacteria bacterium REEB65]|nr:biopolymer transporter ExbD [Cyanobacteria bacterium REEB65]